MSGGTAAKWSTTNIGLPRLAFDSFDSTRSLAATNTTSEAALFALLWRFFDSPPGQAADVRGL